MVRRARELTAHLALLGCLSLAAGSHGCGREERAGIVITFPASAVGGEAQILERQLERFATLHPGIRVKLQRTPDAADQRHQLYVQWLNARAADPDVLQLDVTWTAEFAAAGWILPLTPFAVDLGDFFPATIRANQWRDTVFALPWFVDVGMLYYRTDLVDGPPATFDALVTMAQRGRREGGIPFGFLWQGSRYEGLVCVFLEHLTGYGGEILDRDGRVVVDSDPGVRALTFMRDAIHRLGVVPEAALNWQEEQTRYAFQNGESVFLRNWPYAWPLLQDATKSKVAGRFAVALMPATSDGRAGAALGGSQLAINTNTEHPDAAWAVIRFLTAPEQMLERAAVLGQLPPRISLYQHADLTAALPIPAASARAMIEHATPRPPSPVWAELSGTLAVGLHRALTRQAEPAAALAAAAAEMRATLERAGLAAR